MSNVSFMRAMTIEQPGPSGRLVEMQRPIPTPNAGEVLIHVAYAGLNRADVFQRQGRYDPPPGVTDIPGLECSGVIAACGADVTQWQPGDVVCALLSGGGYADYAIAKAGHCLPLPQGLGLAESAGLPEAAATVWMALFDEANLQPGEAVLITGGSSGVGTLAIQMVRAFGARVFATVSSEAKAQAVAALGAEPIDYVKGNVAEIIKVQGGVDVVLDMVGGEAMQMHLSALKPRGRVVSIAFLNGAKAELSLGGVLLKQLRWSGVTLRGRRDEEKAGYMAQLKQTVWPWVEAGRVRPIIDSVMAFEAAAAAQERMEKRLHLGKILLQMRP